MTIPIGIDGSLSFIKLAVQEIYLHLEQQRARLEQAVYTETEAAAVLRLSERRLRAVRLRGEIKASKIGGKQVRYSLQDIQEYMLQNRINDPDHPPLDGDGKSRSLARSKKSKSPSASSPTISPTGVGSEAGTG